MPYDDQEISGEYLNAIEEETGRIYDLCGLALTALGSDRDSTSNGLRFLIEQIRDANTHIHDIPFHVNAENLQEG